MHTLFIFSSNLFFTAKLEALAKQSNYIPQFIKSIDELPQNPAKIILDADHPQAIQIAQKYPKQCYIFISHIKTEYTNELKQLGCMHIYPRSLFFTQFQKIIS